MTRATKLDPKGTAKQKGTRIHLFILMFATRSGSLKK